jgi:hypothetical protein
VTENGGAAAPYPDKWARESGTPLVEFFHTRARTHVAAKIAEGGVSWEDVVRDPGAVYSKADAQALEDELMATGHRYEVSATVSLKENPDKYKPLAGITDSGNQETDEQGRQIVGTGDNVFKAEDTSGTARYISDVEKVMEMLVNGVPENTVAIIDDSGGTLTAPILGSFKAVVCMGGTVRSHLGILTREYHVPCLMNAELDGLADGDEVLVEYSKPASDPYADEATQREMRCRVIKLG